MKRIHSTGILAAAALAGAVLAAPVRADEHMKAGAMSHTASAVDLRNAMRQLWEEHIVYTRNFIISALGDLGDTDKVAERLLRNQDDIGNAVKPFYGEEAGKKLAALLRDHILIAADIVKAAKAGNNDGVANGQKRWHANADDISAFLSGANPNWPKAVLTDMLYKHLDFTTTEVVSRIKKDWPADIEAYDKGHAHMLMFADALTNGIVKQFPKKFTN
ncbi:MAG: glycosyltransferase [Acidobacteriota bacterium]